MKRDQRLHPLSWNHHDLLIYADRVRMALTTDHPSYRQSIESLVKQTKEFWSAVFQDHMSAEKEILFTSLASFLDQFRNEMEVINREYDELSELFNHISNNPSADEETKAKLIRFADLVIHHVRFEEGELFSKVQNILPEEEFNRVGHELNKKLPRLCRTKQK